MKTVFSWQVVQAMFEKTYRPNLFYRDELLWTIVFSSPNELANPSEEITARRVLDTFDRSKVSEEILRNCEC